MLATTGQSGAIQPLGEVKWDGWRALVYVNAGLPVRTRTGCEVTTSPSELTGLVEALDGHRAILGYPSRHRAIHVQMSNSMTRSCPS